MPAEAKAPFTGTQGPGVYRQKLGDFQLTALFDGVWYLPIDDKFVRNADAAEVNQALAAAFLPPSVLPISFTALLVNTSSKLVLIDTGTAGQIVDTAGSMLENLRTAGVDPRAVDIILISHFHPDHIDGIKTKDGAKVFPNAEILVVTTPQLVSLADSRRAVAMYKKLNIPPLGVIENMSYFVCPNCSHEADIFGRGGGEQMAVDLGIPFVGRIPIYQPIREGGDRGVPIVASEPDSPAAKAFIGAAERTAAQVSIASYKAPTIPLTVVR